MVQERYVSPPGQLPRKPQPEELVIPEEGIDIDLPTGEKYHMDKTGHISPVEGWTKNIPIARFNVATGEIEPTVFGRAESVAGAVAKLSKGIYEASPFSPAFYRTQEQQRAAQLEDIGEKYGIKTGRTGELAWRATTPEELAKYKPIPELEEIEMGLGYKGGTPGERLVGEWIAPMLVPGAMLTPWKAGAKVAEAGVKVATKAPEVVGATKAAVKPVEQAVEKAALGLKATPKRYAIENLPLASPEEAYRPTFRLGEQQTFYKAVDVAPEARGVEAYGKGYYVSPTEQGARLWGEDVRIVEANIKKALVVPPDSDLFTVAIRAGYSGEQPTMERIIAWAQKEGYDAIVGKSAHAGADHVNIINRAAVTVSARASAPQAYAPITAETITNLPEGALPSIESIIATNYNPNIAVAVGQKFGALPWVGNVIRGSNPMLFAKTAEERAVIAWQQLLDIGQSRAALDMLPAWSTKFPFKIEPRAKIAFGKGFPHIEVKTGSLKVTNVTPKPGEERAILDVAAIAEFPERYILTDVQRAELETLYKILDTRRAVEVAKELDVGDVPLKAGQKYFPRFIEATRESVAEIRNGIKRGVGAKQAFQRGRWYEEIYDGVVGGKDYGTDLRAMVEARLNASYKAEADKMLADFLKKPEFKGRIPEPEWRAPLVGKEGIINIAGLQGRLFPIDTAQIVNKMIDKELATNSILNSISKLNAVARMGQTAIDTGFTLIQGLMVLVNRPDAWGKAFGTSLATIVSPRYASRWATGHSRTLIRMIESGGAPFMSSEFTEAARAGGILGRLPLFGTGFKRFGAAFEIYLDASRTYLFESLERRATTPIERTAVANIVDNMVGISSARRLGVSAFRRQLETNGLYAPRYLRSFVGLTADSFQGGLRGQLAREALAKFTVGTSLFMAVAAKATGQEWRIIPTEDKPMPVMYDPRTPEFMSVEIGGVHMGLGGIWVAGFRLLGSLVNTAIDNPKDFVSIDPHENPIMRYLYGRSSPVASGAIDLVTQRNYLGERLDTPMAYLKEAIDKSFPFWVAGVLTDVPKSGWQQAVANWWGLRAWSVQYYEDARRMAEELIPQIPPEQITPEQQAKLDQGQKLTYDDLNNGQRAWLLETFADYEAKQQQAWDDALRRGTDVEVIDARIMQTLDTSYQGDLREVAEGVVAGTATITNYLDQAEYLRRIRAGQFQYRALFEQYGDPDDWEQQQRWLEENRKPEDQAYEKYMELRGNPPTVGGTPDWDAWREQMNSFLATQTPQAQAYIQQRYSQRLNGLPEPAKTLESLIDKCLQGLDGYYAGTVKQLGFSTYKQYEATLKRDSSLASKLSKLRIAFRQQMPNIDAQLYVLGRVSVVQSVTAKVIAQDLLRKSGLPVSDIPVAEPTKKEKATPSLPSFILE